MRVTPYPGEMNVVNSTQIRCFLTTAQLQSFSRAAEALYLTQPSVSRYIGQLEQEWGVTLLERGKAGVVLTGDGARLLPHARALCAEYARLSAEVGALPGRAHISAATRQFLRYLDRRNALEVPAGCTGFDNQARFVYNHYKISDFL